MDGFPINYYFKYKEDNKRVFLSICITLDCKSSKEAFIKLDEPSFLGKYCS